MGVDVFVRFICILLLVNIERFMKQVISYLCAFTFKICRVIFMKLNVVKVFVDGF